MESWKFVLSGLAFGTLAVASGVNTAQAVRALASSVAEGYTGDEPSGSGVITATHEPERMLVPV